MLQESAVFLQIVSLATAGEVAKMLVTTAKTAATPSVRLPIIWLNRIGAEIMLPSPPHISLSLRQLTTPVLQQTGTSNLKVAQSKGVVDIGFSQKQIASVTRQRGRKASHQMATPNRSKIFV
jgi:hypothetical protein